jgi:hypothetical protein
MMKTNVAIPLHIIPIICLIFGTHLIAYGQNERTITLTNPSLTSAEMEVIKAWSDVDKQSIPSLEEFLKKYKDSKISADASLFLSLAVKVKEIKSGKVKSELVIPFKKLPDKWKVWQKDYAYGGALTFTPESAYIPNGFSVRNDNMGRPVLPTKDGSIFIFESKAPNPKWEWKDFFDGIVIKSEGKEPIYFAVVTELGLVHVQGRCSVTMSDKKTIHIEK